MKLYCRLMPKNDSTEASLVHRLKALGNTPIIDTDGAIVLDYDGPFDQHAMTIISVFDSFGCDRTFVFKDWGRASGEGQDQAPKTSGKINLEGGAPAEA